ncbi:phytanoyl-CoA dioxygenase family protein [Paenibacillus glycanilyticus]|uniref:SnoK protein n=1 Tax=Paenibacillus glycanilyticus TaxID=126569 RepID=A0ABQ6G5D2_9BACL|nr:phytanoyl-CoA dioxygenase family protein [Paenibacillus glycanilyticus]GLX65757.1 SnoK protein [Paenibacillus glycanilyticus]
MLKTTIDKAHYDREGYIVLDNLFTEAEMTELTRHIDVLDEARAAEVRALGQQGISIPNQINFTSHLNLKDPYIQNFACQEKMAELTSTLLQSDVRLYWDQSVYKTPEANRDFPWHQDNGYAPIEPEHYVTCWLALEDSTIENGCIWIHPRTHQQGLVEHKQTEIGKQCYFGDDPGLAVPVKKGSLIAFHSLLFHRSTPNLSQSTRKAYIMQYSQDGAIDPMTGAEYENGPTLVQGGRYIYQAKA